MHGSICHVIPQHANIDRHGTVSPSNTEMCLLCCSWQKDQHNNCSKASWALCFPFLVIPNSSKFTHLNSKIYWYYCDLYSPVLYTWYCVIWLRISLSHLNTLRPRQNGRHFADDIFKCIFLNQNARISLEISRKFVPKVRINNIPGLIQIMAWHRPGDKPLSEPISLLMHICVTRPQWVNHIPVLAC